MMTRLLAFIILSISLCFPANAQTGSAKTQAQLAIELFQLFPDNTSGLISAFNLRQFELDLLASTPNGSGGGLNGVILLGTPQAGWTILAINSTTAVWGPSPTLFATGSPPSGAGSCPIDTQVGGNTRGTFQLNGNCSAGNIILTFSLVAPNGWYCSATDLTNTTNIFAQTVPISASAATLTGTAPNNDVIAFNCGGY